MGLRLKGSGDQVVTFSVTPGGSHFFEGKLLNHPKLWDRKSCYVKTNDEKC